MTGRSSRDTAAESCRCRGCDCDATTPHPSAICFTCREGNHHVHSYAERLEAWGRLSALAEVRMTAALAERRRRS